MPLRKKQKSTRAEAENGDEEAGPPPPPPAAEPVAASEESSDDNVGPPPPPGEADDDDDDDDFGPPPPPGDAANGKAASAGAARQKKRKRTLAHESLYLSHLPSASRYYKSFMHRDTLTRVNVTPHPTNFVITASVDGHVKFWKKQEEGIEFVKHYRAHLGPVVGTSVSADGALYASISSDGTVKVFDVANFGGCKKRQIRRHEYADRAWLPTTCRHDQHA